MSDSQVPVLVITERQDDVEFINGSLRDAGHPVHCAWVANPDDLGDRLENLNVQLITFFADHSKAPLRLVAKMRQQVAPMVPIVVVRDSVDECAMTDAMQDGAQDVVSVGQRQRFCAVAEREMRSFRLERALNQTLNSATQYKRELKAFVAGSADAIAQVQEGIVVESNQPWRDLFNFGTAEDALGPLMDCFDASSQAPLKGALIACGKGQWEGDQLRVNAITAAGASFPVKLEIEASVFDGEPAVKLSVPREVETRKAPEEMVDRAVHVDPSTGFFHRQRFVEFLTDRLSDRSQGGARGLAYLRLDQFREVEESVGPVASEEIIVQLARLLRGMLQDKDVCGRFGGTVFTIMLERGTLRDIGAWAEHAVNRISDHIFEVANNTLSMTCTIGLAEMGPGTDRVEDLLAEAARANRRGRERGGNQVVVEETSDKSTRIKRFDALWVHQIKSALVENRFRLVHMGIASLGDGAKRYYDTVLRMIDQQGEEAPAAEFMSAAKRNKLLRPIDRWVIASSVAYCARQEFDLLFVKLSHESVTDISLVDWIGTLVTENRVDPSRICFQVSEEDATQYLKQTNATAARLKAAGFRFAIEHFGIGRDSARVLSQTPMNFIKIDGSLMQSLAADNALQERVRGFVRAAAQRKIETVAERVEDANTMAVLFQLGVGYMQGYYVHEPEVVLQEHH